MNPSAKIIPAINSKLSTLVLEGLKSTGNFRDCLTLIQESLTFDEYHSVEQFFFWLDKSGFTIGSATIHHRYAQFTNSLLMK